MVVTTYNPIKEYPYLAVWNAGDTLSDEQISNIRVGDIVLINKLPDEDGEEGESGIYVQKVLGGEEGFFTNNEHEYFRLPKGFEVKIVQ